MYEQACGFVERKDLATGKLLPQAAALQKAVLLRKGYREIRSRRDNGFVRVVSGDKDTVDGVIVTLGLVDELHRHKDGGQLYGVLADGVGPRNGQIFTISTAGETMKSALGRIRAKALKLPGIKRKRQVHVRAVAERRVRDARVRARPRRTTARTSSSSSRPTRSRTTRSRSCGRARSRRR
jgi:hypothetical protein